MADTQRELSQWRKGKAPIVIKYSDDHSKMMSEIAGRGFLSLPGYAYEMENQLEVAAKMGLADLNYKILSETIDRELKQIGIANDLSYRDAMIAWELEKQSLTAAWAAEYKGIEQGMASDEAVLNQLEIEVSRRQIDLTTQKTALEVAMEAERKILAQLEGSAAPYEVQLANAKLLTAQKKLEIIPVIQEIITKEQELLAIEQTKAAAYTGYMAAEQEVAAKKQTMVPFVNDLATLSEEYAAKIGTLEIPIEQQIAAEKLNHALIAVQKSTLQVEELTTEIATENKNLALMDEKRSLQEKQFGYEQALISSETSLTSLYENDQMADFETLLQEEKDTNANVIADRDTIHGIKIKTAETSAIVIASTERSTDTSINDADIYGMQKKAEIDAAVHITAALEHLIG